MKRKNINIWEVAAQAVISSAQFTHETPVRDFNRQEKKFLREFGSVMGEKETDAYLDFLIGKACLS